MSGACFAAFLAGAFLAGAFLAAALAGAFWAGAFLAGAFLAGAFLAAEGDTTGLIASASSSSRASTSDSCRPTTAEPMPIANATGQSRIPNAVRPPKAEKIASCSGGGTRTVPMRGSLMENFRASPTRREASRWAAISDLAIGIMFASPSLSGISAVTCGRLTVGMTDIARVVGPETIVAAGVRLLTPPLRELYAVLVRTGLVVLED